jgi:hypothetical protein
MVTNNFVEKDNHWRPFVANVNVQKKKLDIWKKFLSEPKEIERSL